MQGTNPNINDAPYKSSALNATSSVKSTSTPFTSGDPMMQPLLDYLNNLYNSLVNPFTSAVQRYAVFLEKLAVLESEISKLITGSSDTTKPINVDCKTIKDKISELLNAFEPPNDAAIQFKSTATGAEGKAEADMWAKELGISQNYVKQGADGKWTILIDLDPLYAVKESFNQPSGNFDTARYQQLISGKDTNVGSFQTRAKTWTAQLAQRINEANNTATIVSSSIKAKEDTNSCYLTRS